MAILITTLGEHRHDQTSGLEKDDITLDADLSQLPDPFENFLLNIGPTLATEISVEQLANAADYYETEAETTLKRTAIILPVIIYICVAVYIAFHIVEAMSTMLKGRTLLPESF